MDATEAIIYCIGFKNDVLNDGEYHSATAFDKDGSPHWVTWCDGVPRLQSETLKPFAEYLAPYKT